VSVARKKRRESPRVDIDMTEDEAAYLRTIMGEELKVTGEAIEVAEEEIKRVFESPIVRDLEELLERGWFWFTVIPSKPKEED